MYSEVVWSINIMLAILLVSVGAVPSSGEVACLVVIKALSPGSPINTVTGIGCPKLLKVASSGPVGELAFNIAF